MNKEDLYKGLNDGVKDERLRAFEINLRKNKPYIEDHGGLLPVTEMLAGKHVVIAGAGYSLAKSLPQLKELSRMDNVVIISSDMALRPLVKYGIFPKFVISCETTPRYFFDDIDSSRISLLAFSCVCSRTVRYWRGRVFFYNWMIKSEPYSTLWRRAGEGLGFAATGSTVVTQGLSIALGCAIRSAALFGNDLAYKNFYYLPQTVSHHADTCNSTRIDPLPGKEFRRIRNARQYVVRRGERSYYTHNQFLAAKYWIEDLAGKLDMTLLDCSEPGVAGKNILNISMKQYYDFIMKEKNG
jgi:hypothetical protein